MQRKSYIPSLSGLNAFSSQIGSCEVSLHLVGTNPSLLNFLESTIAETEQILESYSDDRSQRCYVGDYEQNGGVELKSLTGEAQSKMLKYTTTANFSACPRTHTLNRLLSHSTLSFTRRQTELDSNTHEKFPILQIFCATNWLFSNYVS